MLTDHHRLNLSAAAASIAVAALLILLKLWALVATGALSIGASLVDSALDLTIALANLAAIRYAARPADENHRFGHTAIEDLVALAQATLVVGSALLILASAALRLRDPVPLAAEGAGLAVMAASVVLTGGLVLWQRWRHGPARGARDRRGGAAPDPRRLPGRRGDHPQGPGLRLSSARAAVGRSRRPGSRPRPRRSTGSARRRAAG